MATLEECAKRVGTTVRDKWTLERLLGVGGMAAVYVAVHKIGRRDAIKILHPEVAKSPEVRARFEQEAQAVNRFKHPGVVEIRDIDVTEDGAPFLVMELLEGETLSRIVRRDPGPSVGEILRWTDELLDVLVAAHAQGIIHRDVKPDNLFVQTDGRLKVLDFGIARVRSGAAMSMKTVTGATIGTVSYMPPEQAKGKDVDARVDIFAVGATMFRLLARRKVHEAASDFELLTKVSTTPAPRLATVAPSAPEAFARIVDRALQFDREARYPTAAAMQADVRALRSETPSALAASVPTIPLFDPSPMATSIEIPASERTGPDPSADRSEAATVGRPVPPSPEPPLPPSVATNAATRHDATLRSGPEPEPPQLVTARIAPIARPVAAPPAPVASPPSPPASAPVAHPFRWKLALIIAGAIAVFAIIVLASAAATGVWFAKLPDVGDDAAIEAASPDAPGGDDGGAATPPPASSATHKPTASPTKPVPAPASSPSSKHPPHGK